MPAARVSGSAFCPANGQPSAVPGTNAAPAARVDVKSMLLSIVAERTGYPTEMLDVDADLEADLGIDSIKRVEIIGALQKALPDTLAAGTGAGGAAAGCGAAASRGATTAGMATGVGIARVMPDGAAVPPRN